MAEKLHRNIYQVPTTSDERLEEVLGEIKYRELLFNRTKNQLGIKIDDDLIIPKPLVDEYNVTFNENDEIALKNDITVDSVTTQADHNGIDWKSQTKIAETTLFSTVVLLFRQDKEELSDKAVFGGEVIEVGDNVYSHYQVSITSTGSRLLKGATTNDKKARPCLAKYNGVYYYGLHFKNSSPANIYFAGWQKIPAGLAAPTAVYTDGDMSEVIDLDDDSDTEIEVIDFNFYTFDDFTWEFEDAPVVSTTTSGSNTYEVNQDTLTFRDDFKGEGESSFGSGYAHKNAYYRLHWYSNVDYTAPSTGARVTASHRIALGGWYLTSASSGLAGYIYVPQGIGSITMKLLNQQTNIDRQIRLMRINSDRSIGSTVQEKTVPRGNQWTDVTFTNIAAGEYYFYQTGQISYSSVVISWVNTTTTSTSPNWHQNGDNSGYDLTNGLEIVTGKNTSWFDLSLAENNGYITFNDITPYSSPAMKLRVLAKATVTVGFNSNNGSYSTNLRITESLDTSSTEWAKSVSKNSTSNSSITTVTYDYDGNGGYLYFLGEVGSVNILYVTIDYDNSVSNGTIIANIINSLPDTSEDGSPHIIRLSGEITKEALIKIASVLADSNVQTVLDLSRCTMESAYRDWTADTELTGLFKNCNSLREFYYPQNVTSSGGNTFKNCSFLRAVHFNAEMTHLGSSNSVWSWENNAMFSGARVKTLYLPKSIATLGGYPFSYSNIVNVFVEEGSAFLNNRSFGQWNTFVQVKEAFRFRAAQAQYNNIKSWNQTFQGYGADGDGVNYISTSCKFSDHIELWDGEEEDIDYTTRYEDL